MVQIFLNFSLGGKELEDLQKFYDGVESFQSRSNNCLVFQGIVKKIYGEIRYLKRCFLGSDRNGVACCDWVYR